MWFWAFNVYFNAPECVLCHRDPELIPKAYLLEIQTLVSARVGLVKAKKTDCVKWTDMYMLHCKFGIVKYDRLLRSSGYKMNVCMHYVDTVLRSHESMMFFRETNSDPFLAGGGRSTGWVGRGPRWFCMLKRHIWHDIDIFFIRTSYPSSGCE